MRKISERGNLFASEETIFSHIHRGDRIFIGTACGEPQYGVVQRFSYFTVTSTFKPYLSDPNQPFYGDLVVANLNRSQGFEGMAYSLDRQTLYPLLEGRVTGDPANALRIYKFDVATEEFQDELVGYYRLEASSNAIGDFTPISSRPSKTSLIPFTTEQVMS